MLLIAAPKDGNNRKNPAFLVLILFSKGFKCGLKLFWNDLRRFGRANAIDWVTV